jgi:sorting and assembly machinery component 37
MMVFELHVWGPAFGLPSIDPESLAAITYYQHALPNSEWVQWKVVASTPGSVPTQRLPALFDGGNQTWTSGFTSIVAYITQQDPSSDLDAGLTPLQRADTTACTAYLTQHAAPLLALSLYVSTTNWISTTRPAYSTLLPFPLTWIEPPLIRAAHAAAADLLGLSSLDTDTDAAEESPEEAAARRAGFLQIPAALRRMRDQRLSITAALGPEHAAKIRLDALACDVFEVLDGLKGQKRWFFGDEKVGKPSSLDCLAFAYLALMTVPDVPRAFLRETMNGRFGGLGAFVKDMRSTSPFGWDVPWSDGLTSPKLSASLATDLIVGATSHVPELGGLLSRWWSRHRAVKSPHPDLRTTAAEDRAIAMRDTLTAVLETTGLTALAVGLWYYRQLPAFGSPLFRWESERSYRTFGAVGAALGLGRFGGAFGGVTPSDNYDASDIQLSASPVPELGR